MSSLFVNKSNPREPVFQKNYKIQTSRKPEPESDNSGIGSRLLDSFYDF